MKKFAVFDIDGTLIRWQLYHAVVHELAKQGHLGKDSLKQLNDARMVWKKREDPRAWKNYEHKIIEAYETSFENLSTQDFDQAVSKVLNEYRDQTYVYTLNLLKKLKADGYFLLVISGSHHELIEPLARYYEFDDWIGTKYSRIDERFSGNKSVASHDKGERLKKFIDTHGLGLEKSVAVGDSGSDIAMLELVDTPIAFNPDQTLFEHAKTWGWKIVVERKNVMYELEARDGKYILA